MISQNSIRLYRPGSVRSTLIPEGAELKLRMNGFRVKRRVKLISADTGTLTFQGDTGSAFTVLPAQISSISYNRERWGKTMLGEAGVKGTAAGVMYITFGIANNLIFSQGFIHRSQWQTALWISSTGAALFGLYKIAEWKRYRLSKYSIIVNDFRNMKIKNNLK